MKLGQTESELFTHKELLMITTALVTLKESTAHDNRWTDKDEDIYCSLLNRFPNLQECEDEIIELAQLVQDEYL